MRHSTPLCTNAIRADDQFEVSEHAGDYPRWDYAVAAKVLDEYRAEWQTPRSRTLGSRHR